MSVMIKEILNVMNIFMGIISLIVGLGLATPAIRLVPELKAKSMEV